MHRKVQEFIGMEWNVKEYNGSREAYWNTKECIKMSRDVEEFGVMYWNVQEDTGMYSKV